MHELARAALTELETDEGILASGREELYGCIFGRDSLITALILLDAYGKNLEVNALPLVRKILTHLAYLQGSEMNIESGEEPGKMIHEYRPSGHEHLTMHDSHPWFLYPDGIMRNYDTVDATPLYLMTMHEYLRISHDESFVAEHDATIRAALEWLMVYGDHNGDRFIDYRFHPERKSGGLRVQSWMDSSESVFFEEDDAEPTYSIAPVEVQAYAYAALRMWGIRMRESDGEYGDALLARAEGLKEAFNERFTLDDGGLAFALDGEGKQLTSARSSMGHVLFAVYRSREDGHPTGILDEKRVEKLVVRLMQPDLFVPNAGLRTLSSASRHYNPNSYHNGSIWPHDTYLVALGLERYGYQDEANKLKAALTTAYTHFGACLELYIHDGALDDYRSESGQTACRTQAWSAATLLALTA